MDFFITIDNRKRRLYYTIFILNVMHVKYFLIACTQS